MCAKNLTIKLLILINLLNAIKCANILAVFPIPFKEHQVIYRPLLEKLANYGHNILLLTTDSIDFNKVGNQSIEQNIEQIDLGFVYDLEVLDKLQNSNLDGTKMLKNVFSVMRSLSVAELQNPNVQKLIRNHQNYKFDAVIAEWSGVSIMNAFAYTFNVPLIGISTGGAFINSHEAFGNPNHPTAYPSIFMPFTEDLNIFQRITSVFFSIWYRYYYYTEELPLQNAIAQTYFGEELPDLWKIESQADLLLINSYQVLGNIRPVVPTTIYLGGIHQELNVKPMTTSLQAFIQDSVGPMVYVNINHDTSFRLEKILRSLEAINANIIWNNNDGQIINTTCRIYQNYDASQETILNSKHVDVFITDGGQHNIEDAIHNRVPVLGISYSTTLEHYLRQIEKHEAGLISFIDFETQTTLTDKIRKALQKEIYQANMNELSRLVLDQPMTSVERAIWWIEYVIRNNGTRHLQAPKLPWFQYLLLDVGLAVVFVWSIILCAISFIIYRLVRYSKSLPFEMVTRGSKKAKVL